MDGIGSRIAKIAALVGGKRSLAQAINISEPSFKIQDTLLRIRAQLQSLHQAALHADLQGHQHPIPFSLLLENLLTALDQLDQDLEHSPSEEQTRSSDASPTRAGSAGTRSPKPQQSAQTVAHGQHRPTPHHTYT